jgi:hypothetical protein
MYAAKAPGGDLEMMRTIVAVVTGASAFLLVGGHALGSPTCDAAMRELDDARRNLSRATRDADVKAAAYYDCMKRSDNSARSCAQQSKTLHQALARRRGARDAYQFAEAAKKRACR